ncbi:MAG: bifunctional metallophosphatase/5'-nucleotidase [Limnothrix sp.]
MSIAFVRCLSVAGRGAVALLLSLSWLGHGGRVWAEIVTLQILQLNDVYEITPLSGGTVGGLARVATIRQGLIEENPNTLTVMAGDFFSPSALGTAVVDGDRLAGEQMVNTLNHLGLDLATFGNHEFDVKEHQFRSRLAESEFQWFSGNVRTAAGEAWDNVPPYFVTTVTGENGAEIRVGFVGVTLPSNPAPYVSYLDPFVQMQQSVAEIRDETEIIVGLTHVAIADDQRFAAQIPEIDLILGGHEHENIQLWRGQDFTPIFKADANARTVYIHQLAYDTDLEKLTINSRLQLVNEAIAPDPQLEAIINYWQQKAFDAFRDSGFTPEAIVAVSPIALDGLESSVRQAPTNLTDLIAKSMLTAAPDAELAIFNSGSIRIDDVLPASAISQYDVIRILPFGGEIITVDLTGAVLAQTLNQSLANVGTGGYLHTAAVSQEATTQQWLINNVPLDAAKIYRVAITDFLISGKETGLDFLNLDNPDITAVENYGDVRFALIQQLQQKW